MQLLGLFQQTVMASLVEVDVVVDIPVVAAFLAVFVIEDECE